MALIKVADNGISSGVNTPSFLTTIPTSTTISENTNALVPYSTEVFDTHNAYNNTAGNYKFTDYWRLGLPLDILIIVISIPMILFVWT